MKSSALTVKRIAMTEAHHHLGEVIKFIRLNKEYVVLERDGYPVVGLMDIDEFEDYLELRDPGVREQIRRSHQDYLAGRTRSARALLEEVTPRHGSAVSSSVGRKAAGAWRRVAKKRRR